GLRGGRAVLARSEPRGPAVRGRGAGELRGPRQRRWRSQAGGQAAHGGRREGGASLPAGPPGRGRPRGAGPPAPRLGGGVGGQALVGGVKEATAEVKYFLSNATAAPLARVLAVAFRRWAVEHCFRLGKQEAGLLHYEGRDYTGLVRHLILALVVLGFVATQTERLRGEKPAGDGGAGVPGAEPAVCGAAAPPSGR